jgi:hypothetical protein
VERHAVSAHAAFRRQPVPGQYAQQLKAITLPAPTRGIIQSENDAYIGPGACIISDNWLPTMKGVKLRGGYIRWCDLHGVDGPAWQGMIFYPADALARDTASNTLWRCVVPNIAGSAITFADWRALNPTFWVASSIGPPPPVPDPSRKPIISAFEYVDANIQRMFAAQHDKLYDVTNATPLLIASGRTSGNYAASQMANLAGNWMLAVNETGDGVLRFDGTTWTPLTTELTGGPVPGTSKNLSYVCKYRNRYFFIETKSMNAWYLPIDSHQGALVKVPLSGAATRGGYLLFLTVWTIDAGDGIDDKLVAVTSEGEALIFTGGNPADPATWRQEGRYFVGKPMGMNAHTQVGGDVLILTTEGIVPLSQTIQKSAGEMELALISRAIKRMWREEVAVKSGWPWTIKKWDEYGGTFVTFPGGTEGNRYCLAMNATTGAFARAVGWDATCFLRMRGDFFFGTQDGIVMQAERTGYDDGNHRKLPYVCTLVGGWETFQARTQMVVWHQARAVFRSGNGEPFQPSLDSTTDYVVVIPPPPLIGPDPGVADVWDQGVWGPDMGGPPPPIPTPPQRAQYAQWDQATPGNAPIRNTLWVSIGKTGFSHAPIVQVTIGQSAKPDVELVAIGATFEVAGVNV